MTEKLIRDGKVAVIYSPGFGAGWSTWNDDKERMVFDPVLAQMILDGADVEALTKVATERHPKAYMGGLRNVKVEWLPVGTVFLIDEYDGSESIVTSQTFTMQA